MRKNLIVAAVAFGLGIGFAMLMTNGRDPGETPIGVTEAPTAKAHDGVSGGGKVKYWRAPMDPSYTSDEPGKSPMGMDLIPVYEDQAGDVSGATLQISPAFAQNMGVQSREVTKGDIPLKIRTVGNLTYDHKQVTWVNTKFEGWIEKVYVNYVGEEVEKGERLFDIYSPQLVTTQKEYLQSLDYWKRFESGSYPEVAARAKKLVDAGRQRLSYWDINETQIRELEESGEVRRTLAVVSPVDGLVVERTEQASEGSHVDSGTNLYKLVDLSTIWVEAEVFEHQLPWLKVGQSASVSPSHGAGTQYRGNVRFLHPASNRETRTVSVSIELPNPRRELRADMYVDVTFEVPSAHDVLTVPEESVLYSGERNLVVLDLGGGAFEVRQVTLGVNGDNRWEVREGLEEGERVVISAQFLIDSESNLRQAVQKIVTSQNGKDGQTGGLVEESAPPAAKHQP